MRSPFLSSFQDRLTGKLSSESSFPPLGVFSPTSLLDLTHKAAQSTQAQWSPLGSRQTAAQTVPSAFHCPYQHHPSVLETASENSLQTLNLFKSLFLVNLPGKLIKTKDDRYSRGK